MTSETLNLTVEGTLLKVSTKLLDGQGADGLVTAMNADNIYTLDFGGVEDINFAALRSLLRCRQAGQRFCIVNACDKVTEKFEDSGVSVFISICRKPRPLDISKYEEFGAGFLSKAFNCKDGDSMLKVYGPRVPKNIVAQEKAVARAVMVFGIPTPLVGSLYEEGDNTCIDFERIEGKRSFSRIISEEPDRLEEMTVKFARMCKKLHTTQCDTNLFSDRSMFYRQAVANCKEIPESTRAKAFEFINSVPCSTTCLHGDMQLSNVITNGKDDLWIDLSDFGYGNPMFDMGMWYFLIQMNQEERMQHIFHFGIEVGNRIWPIFAREYFGADTPEKLGEVTSSIIPFATLHMIYLGANYGFEDGMVDFIVSSFK